MQLSNIATVGAQTVALRIDNTSLYKPYRPQVNRLNLVRNKHYRKICVTRIAGSLHNFLN